jgi:hypothetical protein
MLARLLIWSRPQASYRIVIGFLMVGHAYAFAAEQTDGYGDLMDRGYEQLGHGEVERLQGDEYIKSKHFREALVHLDRALEFDKAALSLFQAAEREAPPEKRRHPAFFQ